jgi:cytidine deaminase
MEEELRHEPTAASLYLRAPEARVEALTNDELITAAVNALRRRTVNGRIFGDVAAALITDQGKVFTGIAIDTPSWGLCAERSAIAAMATAGEYRIRTIVAVWKEDETIVPDGPIHVLPPCGACRQFMSDINEGNLETVVILGPERVMKLKDLLPYHEWPAPLDYSA